jgi:hypothetical protein
VGAAARDAGVMRPPMARTITAILIVSAAVVSSFFFIVCLLDLFFVRHAVAMVGGVYR